MVQWLNGTWDTSPAVFLYLHSAAHELAASLSVTPAIDFGWMYTDCLWPSGLEMQYVATLFQSVSFRSIGSSHGGIPSFQLCSLVYQPYFVLVVGLDRVTFQPSQCLQCLQRHMSDLLQDTSKKLARHHGDNLVQQIISLSASKQLHVNNKVADLPCHPALLTQISAHNILQ